MRQFACLSATLLYYWFCFHVYEPAYKPNRQHVLSSEYLAFVIWCSVIVGEFCWGMCFVDLCVLFCWGMCFVGVCVLFCWGMYCFVEVCVLLICVFCFVEVCVLFWGICFVEVCVLFCWGMCFVELCVFCWGMCFVLLRYVFPIVEIVPEMRHFGRRHITFLPCSPAGRQLKYPK